MSARTWAAWFASAALPSVSLSLPTMQTSAALCAEADVTADADTFAYWLMAACFGENEATASPHMPSVSALSVAQLSVAARQTWRKTSDRLAAIDELQRRYLAASAARLLKLAREYERP